MVLTGWILASGTVALVAVRPRSARLAPLVGALAGVDVAVLGPAPLGPALRAAWPMLAVMGGALGVARALTRLGVVERAARLLARGSGASPLRLYWAVCALTAALTCSVSLDGAVVLMAPVVVALRRELDVPLRPLLVGVVAVANACSAAVPLGNPRGLADLAATADRRRGPFR